MTPRPFRPGWRAVFLISAACVILSASPLPAEAAPAIAWGDVLSAQLWGRIIWQFEPQPPDSLFFPPEPMPLHLTWTRSDGMGENLVWAEGTVEPAMIGLDSHWWSYHGMYYMGADLRAGCSRAFGLASVEGAVRVGLRATLQGNLSSGCAAQWSLGVAGTPPTSGARNGGGTFVETPEWVGVLRSGQAYNLETSLTVEGESAAGQATCSLNPLSSLRVVYERKPLILRVSDIPADQGGQARICWWRSSGDGPDSMLATGYAIYRRAESRSVRALAQDRRRLWADSDNESAGAARGTSLEEPRRLEGWDYVTTVPVRGDSIYQTVVPTLCDSTADGGVCWSTFFVSALTSNPYVFYDSPPDSGYSVDNLVPAAPQNLAFGEPGLLGWDEATEPDFAYYSLYGSEFGELDSTAVLLLTTTQPEAAVAGLLQGYFHVTATDFAGNRSDASSIENPAVSSVGPERGAAGLVLFRPEPNPSDGAVVFRFELPRSSLVRLQVFDPAGRLKVSLGGEVLVAGRHEIAWDGKDAAGAVLGSGAYFCRLQAGEFARVCRIVQVRR